MPDDSPIVTRQVEQSGVLCPRCGEFFEAEYGPPDLSSHMHGHAEQDARFRWVEECCARCAHCIVRNDRLGGFTQTSYRCRHPKLLAPGFLTKRPRPMETLPDRVCEYFTPRQGDHDAR